MIKGNRSLYRAHGARAGISCTSRVKGINLRPGFLLPFMQRDEPGTKKYHYFLTNKRCREMRPQIKF